MAGLLYQPTAADHRPPKHLRPTLDDAAGAVHYEILQSTL
jgi:hypothetical protein